MKYRFLLSFFLFSGATCLYAQDAPVKKPAYIYIADGKMISRQALEELATKGGVASMNKGVSQEVRDSLARKFGDTIQQKEFVILIGMRDEKEITTAPAGVGSPRSLKDRQPETESPLKSPLIGKVVSDFTVPMSDGREVRLSALKGKVVMLNFWATWCSPCLMEFYDFPSRLIQPFADKPFVLLPIDKGETKEVVLAKMQQLAKDGLRFPVGWDKSDAIWTQLGGTSLPRSILIDKKGVVRFVVSGGGEENLDTLVRKIGELVNE